MNCAGLDKLCLLPQDFTTVDGEATVTNEEIRAIVNLAPDRFIGFASVDPFDSKAAEKLEKAFTDLGLLGFKTKPGQTEILPDRCGVKSDL
jgi:predicted TIM-barrel fold metal-dependent hydrolase